MLYSASWSTAERTAFDALIVAAGSTEGKDAFLGLLPAGAFNVWMFSTGGGGITACKGYSSISLAIPAVADGLFDERADAQIWVMKVVQALPVIASGNVQRFFVDGAIPKPELMPIPLANDARESALLWKVTLNFTLVFDTEKAAGETTARAPVNVQATRGSSATEVTLTWTAASTAASYTVWRSATNDNTTAVSIGTPSTATYSDTTAVSGTVYFYWVKSVNVSGVSAFSAAAEGWTS